MSRKSIETQSTVVGLCLLSLTLAGCHLSTSFPNPKPQAPIAQTAIPPLPPLGQPVLARDDGSRVFELEIADQAVWIYTPPQAVAQGAKLPAVLIAPAGSNLLNGMELAEGDRAEHIPYLDAGFVVIAYALAGAEDTQTFAAAQGGLKNGRNALALAKQLPFVDPNQIFTAGHSSAGEAALLLASHEPSLAGLLMFNSAGEGCWHHSSLLLKTKQSNAGFIEFCQQTRAASYIKHLKVPTFIFGSKGDNITTSQEIDRLLTSMNAAGVDVSTTVVETGGHYESMIQAGIPTGIDWMQRRMSVAR